MAGDDAIPRRPVVWTIAGTDSGGGAGIHADTRALDAFGVHGACAVAAVTAQHSLAVTHVEPVSPAVLGAQLEALAADMPPDAIKTGLLASVENLRVVVAHVRRLRARFPDRAVPLVVDPVFGATTGASFADEALRVAYREELLPLATLATPNVAEARALVPSSQLLGPEPLARAWRAFGARAVVVTGGDSDRLAEEELEQLSTARLASRLAEIDSRAAWAHDWLDAEHGQRSRGWLASRRIETEHDHGTGCVFASAAAAAMAHGFVAADAVVLAKMATCEGLRNAYAAGGGAGPVAPRAGFATRLANLPVLNPLPDADSRFAFPAMPGHTRGLYAIVDSSAWVARVLAEGVRLVQLRVKEVPADLLVREIRAAVAIARAVGATLIVNDHWELALELGAHGVHLGQDDLAGADIDALHHAGLLLGISTHSYWEVCRARALRPSYIACGPIHATTLKQMPWIPQGDANLAYWCALLHDTPVVAIGGMDAARARDAMRAGAWAVAVVGAITRSEDPRAAIGLLQQATASVSRAAPGSLPAFARTTLDGSDTRRLA
ncbi:thiamine phosphate synthase [Scleromatobacter humisilvae]|uniref:Thiamine phosphate synthase n=1 Tax=Scleromatobacter humisilvae TaxID=2897159 RepID=A0A9X1YGZ5_9BURK|nr:thiamine phosphate synthase [Scleromatobacter humisilvae]MCK9684670.1 thiamine phosphate synthase [Scleromatobacter humisilvae]